METMSVHWIEIPNVRIDETKAALQPMAKSVPSCGLSLLDDLDRRYVRPSNDQLRLGFVVVFSM